MKKALIAALCIISVIACFIGGTFAYDSSSDSASVVSSGDISVEQNITQTSGEGTVDVSEASFAFMPVRGVDSAESGSVISTDDITGEVERRVSVTNAGDTPIYVRTVFALPYSENYGDAVFGLIANTQGEAAALWASEEISGIAEIDGKQYKLVVYTYKNALNQKGDTTVPGVTHIYLKQDIEAKDLKSTGHSMELPVMTQAVSVTGSDAQTDLDEAFGDITASSHPFGK